MKFLPSIGFVNFGILLNFVFCPITKAQVIPDSSLPNNSEVTSNGEIIQIEGGTERGANLFHSFEEFSVPVDRTASFNNSADIQNIFSRVTGSSVSEINGTLETQGTASLFLINPNGIIFGENALLNLGGSFLATTAENILFEDGTQFNTTADGTTTPLLTITAPVGLGLGTNSGTIINRSSALVPNEEYFPLGLVTVEPFKTLAFLGGEIILDGGSLSVADGGRIELGAVADENIVGLMSDERGWTFNYEEINSFKDINLSQSTVSSFPDRSGDIKIQGKNITLSEGSQIISLTTSNSNAGSLIVKGSESVVLNGFNTLLLNYVIKTASSETEILNIKTKKLSILNGASVSTSAFGTEARVNLRIDASELVEIDGINIDEFQVLPSSLSTGGRLFIGIDRFIIGGNQGDLTLTTKKLTITNGGQILASTFDQSNAGNLTIIASDSILLEGTDSEGDISSGIFAQVEPEATGNGGSLSIETPELTVLDGAEISTIARNNRQGGNITIDFDTTRLNSLLLRDSQITANAFDSARGGNITLNFDGIALLDDSNINTNAERGQGGNIQITTQGILQESNNQITATSESGTSGTITFNTPDVDPVSGIEELPDVPIDTEAILAQDFCKLEDEKIAKGSSFIITGRGGLIPTSKDSLTNRDRLVDWASRDDIEVSQSGAVEVRQRQPNLADEDYPKIQQSQGLLVAKDGTTWLTANAPETIAKSSQIAHPDCHSSKAWLPE